MVIATLAGAFAVTELEAQIRKTLRTFHSPPETVWAAAVDIARQEFVLGRVSKREGRLRFRAGPLRGYRFEVVVFSTGRIGRTRVEMELRTDFDGMDIKDARRNGDRYFALLAERLSKHSEIR